MRTQPLSDPCSSLYQQPIQKKWEELVWVSLRVHPKDVFSPKARSERRNVSKVVSQSVSLQGRLMVLQNTQAHAQLPGHRQSHSLVLPYTLSNQRVAYLLILSAAMWVSPPRPGLAHKGNWRNRIYPLHCFRKEDKQLQTPQPYFLPSTVQPCHLFLFRSKKTRREKSNSSKTNQKKEVETGKTVLVSLQWVPERDTLNLAKHSPTQFHPLQRHQHVSELYIFPISHIWSGTDESFIPACLSFLFSNWVWLVGSLSPFSLSVVLSFFWLLFPFPFYVCVHKQSVLFCFSLLVLIAVRWQCPFTAWRSNVPSVE